MYVRYFNFGLRPAVWLYVISAFGSLSDANVFAIVVKDLSTDPYMFGRLVTSTTLHFQSPCSEFTTVLQGSNYIVGTAHANTYNMLLLKKQQIVITKFCTE